MTEQSTSLMPYTGTDTCLSNFLILKMCVAQVIVAD